MTKPVPYDALEATHHILLVVDAPHFESGLARVAIIPGHGIEIFRPDGASIRFGNLHPRLFDAAISKSVLLATIQGDEAAIAGLPEDDIASDAGSWFPEAFYWYLEPPSGHLSELANRPLPRLLSIAGTGVVAAASGRPSTGPAIGLCIHAMRMVPLPSGRSWTPIRPSLTVDDALLEGRGCHPVDNDIQATVAAAFRYGPRSANVEAMPWRSQVAAFIPAT